MKKFTTKQLNGYYKAKREWISANDNYNLATFKITQSEYAIIRRVETGVFGICQGTDRLKLSQLNQLADLYAK